MGRGLPAGGLEGEVLPPVHGRAQVRVPLPDQSTPHIAKRCSQPPEEEEERRRGAGGAGRRGAETGRIQEMGRHQNEAVPTKDAQAETPGLQPSLGQQ